MSLISSTIFVMFLLGYQGTFGSLQVTENPRKPLSKDAYRTKKIEEVFRVKEGEGFFLSHPSKPSIGPDGNIYVLDENQLLQFSPEGKFLGNLHKKGQGPGEFEYISGYQFDSDSGSIILYGTPRKILYLKTTGEPEREFAIPTGAYLNFLCIFKDQIWFTTSEFMNPGEIKGMEAIIDQPNRLVYYRQGAANIETVANIPSQLYFLRSSKGAVIMAPMTRILVASTGRYLFLSHTPEYGIKVFDLEEKKLVFSFRRDYPRVKPPSGWRQESGTMIDGKPVFLPTPKYLNDIEKIFISEDKIWVVTSTVEPKKGVLVDVFDYLGHYEDAFYLPLPPRIGGKSWADRQYFVKDNIIVAIIYDEEENPIIVKYKILP